MEGLQVLIVLPVIVKEQEDCNENKTSEMKRESDGPREE